MPLSEILRFYLPLVLTSQMMTLSVPLINLGLGRVDDPAVALAGYAVGFSVGVLFNSPVLAARTVTAGLVRDAAGHAVVARFMRRLALGLSGAEVLIAATSLGDLVFQGLLGAPPQVAGQARITLLLQSPIPVLLAERGLDQGVALLYRRTLLITASTLARLAAVTGVVLLLALVLRLPGAASGGLALTAGIAMETLLIRSNVRRHVGLYASPPPDGQAPVPLTAAAVARFAMPLMLNHAVWSMQRGLINAIISRLADPLAALATFGVVQPLFLFTGSPLFGIQATVQVLPRHRADLRRLAWFTGGTSALLAVAMGLFVVLAGRQVLAAGYGLEGHLVALAMPALLWIWLEPFLLGFRSFGQGLLMRIRRTGPIAVSAALRVAVVAGAGLAVVGLRPQANGALVGVALLMLGDAWDMGVACLWGWLRRDLLGVGPAPEAAATAPRG